MFGICIEAYWFYIWNIFSANNVDQGPDHLKVNKETKWIKKTKNGFLINLICCSTDFDETCWSCSTHEYYNFTKFHQNRIKHKKVLSMARFCKQTADIIS